MVPNLIGIINEVLKSDNVIIGKIQILKSFSFFEIDKKKEKIIISLLNGKKIKGVSLVAQVAKEDPKSKSKINNNRKTKKSFKKNKRKLNLKRK